VSPVHKVAGVAEAIEAAGATLIYLPKYSPDLRASLQQTLKPPGGRDFFVEVAHPGVLAQSKVAFYCPGLIFALPHNALIFQ
jgi:hypothetical protein